MPSPFPTVRFRPTVERLADRINPSAPLARVSLTAAGAQADRASTAPAISADGRFVVFESLARLASTDTNDTADVYLADRANGGITLISTDAAGNAVGNSSAPDISADGRVVVFQSSATTLANGFGGATTNIFVHDIATRSTTVVSRIAAGTQGDDSSFRPSVSGDGRYVVFDSIASNLVTGFGGPVFSVFVFDRTTGTTAAASLDSTGSVPNADAYDADISADGQTIAFVSAATDIVTGFGGVGTIFVYNRSAATNTVASLDSTAASTNAGASSPSISDNGRYVAYASAATDIVTGFGGSSSDVFVRDLSAGTTSVASARVANGQKANGNGASSPSISGNGRYVAFLSDSLDLVSGIGAGSQQVSTAVSVFVWDSQGTPTAVAATPVTGTSTQVYSPILSPIALSRDGRILAFASADSTFLATDTNTVADVFAVERPIRTGFAAGAGAGGSPVAKLYNPDGTLRLSLQAYDTAYTGGVFVATGDVTGDGVEDLVTSTGPGGTANIRIFDGRTGSLVRSFFGYPTAFIGGVNVALGDVNNDGYADLVCGVGVGGGPNVRVFSGQNGGLLTSFFAYPEGFTGGVRVAATDINRDGYADIVCAVGSGGGPNVRVYDGLSGALLTSFFAYSSTFTGGLFVSAGDFNADGVPDLVTGVESGGGPNVRSFDLRNGTTLQSFFAYDSSQPSGVRVASADVNGDGYDDYITGTGLGPGSLTRVLSGRDGSTPLLADFAPFGTFRGGVNVG